MRVCEIAGVHAAETPADDRDAPIGTRVNRFQSRRQTRTHLANAAHVASEFPTVGIEAGLCEERARDVRRCVAREKSRQDEHRMPVPALRRSDE
jgi:hypothetical protein